MFKTEKPTHVEDLINDPNFSIDNWYGYVYLTTNMETGKQYIGKKNFRHTKNVKLGKKELAALPVTRGRKPTTKEVLTESDWKTYFGSAQEIKDTPKDKLERVILQLCKTKGDLTYYETKYLFSYGVLEDDNKWINDNILGTFYRKNLSF